MRRAKGYFRPQLSLSSAHRLSSSRNAQLPPSGWRPLAHQPETPVTPSSITSEWPATPAAITARSHNTASTIPKGRPSTGWHDQKYSSTPRCLRRRSIRRTRRDCKDRCPVSGPQVYKRPIPLGVGVINRDKDSRLNVHREQVDRRTVPSVRNHDELTPVG